MGIEFLDARADVPDLLGERYISNLMHIVWLSRPDLQQAFNLQTEPGQRGFAGWFEAAAMREHGLEARVPSRTPASAPPTPFWNSLTDRLRDLARRTADPAGVNLIGYARAELGMGEHVRMTAASLATTDIPFDVINLDVGSATREKAKLGHGRIVRRGRYATNIFHVNADQVLEVYRRLGRGFFSGRKNILYPFWELAQWPDAWVPALSLFDEIWAPTRFVRDAIAARTDRPVHHMPVSVSLPEVRHGERARFGLPEEPFLFLFTFDVLSFMERKNPAAAVRAFRQAFPDNPSVGLVLKAMNANPDSPQWRRMLELIGDDKRIIVISHTMDREDVLGLYKATDCFVTLHRSEGFGFCPAEAMYLGRPVIATNYSGSTDLTQGDNACLVDYRLIPVEPGQYVHEHGQVWADADIEQAAAYMAKIQSDADYRGDIARRGQQFVRETFAPAAIGARYRERLRLTNRKRID